MTIQELKATIESGNVPKGLTILKVADSFFVPNQYIDFIRKSVEIVYVETCSDIINSRTDIFDLGNSSDSLKVLKTEEFKNTDERLKSSGNVFIVCRKMDKKTSSVFKDYIIDVPKLEKWQMEDYAYSLAEGVNENQLKNLVEICNYDIYRIDKELQKITIFPKEQRQFIFDSFVNDGIFSDINNHTVFDFTNALLKKDKEKLFELYKEIQNVDVEPIAFPMILIKSFKNVIDVQLSRFNAEQLGMKPNQYWAIKNTSIGFYTKDQLISIFGFLTDLDRRIKVGEMPVKYLVDYIIVKVLGV